MKTSCFLIALFLSTPTGQSAVTQQASVMQAGSIAGDTYQNSALGVRMKIPAGWAGKLPSSADIIDPAHPESKLNKCSQMLFLLENNFGSPHSIRSKSVLFALNPGCFDSVIFPQSDKDRSAVQAYAGIIVELFRSTLYIPPSGVDIGAEHISQHEFIFLAGSGMRTAEDGSKQVHANTLISITESDGQWIVWASLVDDQAKKQLSKSQIQFWEP